MSEALGATGLHSLQSARIAHVALGRCSVIPQHGVVHAIDAKSTHPDDLVCYACSPAGMKVPASVLRHALGSSGSGSSGGGGVTGGESDAAAAAWLKAAFGSNLLDQGPDSAPRWTGRDCG